MTTRRILVADDDTGVIRLVQMVLRPMDVMIQDVRDAFSALVAIRESPPDLAILDINMPAGNGLSVCEMLATDCRLSRVPVIVLTGDPNEDVEWRCNRMGAHYVRKGIEAMDQLKVLVQDMLAAKQTNAVKSQFFIG